MHVALFRHRPKRSVAVTAEQDFLFSAPKPQQIGMVKYVRPYGFDQRELRHKGPVAAVEAVVLENLTEFLDAFGGLRYAPVPADDVRIASDSLRIGHIVKMYDFRSRIHVQADLFTRGARCV